VDTEPRLIPRCPTQLYSVLNSFNNSYAHKYQCPQVFCFDGETLLLLQFRASRESRLEEKDCPVDCWVLPRLTSYTTLRLAMYRLVVQGFRRCQGLHAPSELTLGSLTSSRQFYSGRPRWKVNGIKETEHPEGFQRMINAWGQFVWVFAGQPVLAETNPLWGGT
jgi:hypothetical protein